MSVKYYGTEKVGETFEYNGKKYKVMAGRRGENVCVNCVFHEGKVDGCYIMACMPFRRRDDENEVYYKEVK